MFHRYELSTVLYHDERPSFIATIGLVETCSSFCAANSPCSKHRDRKATMVSPDVAKYDLHPFAIIVLPIPLMILSSIAISIRIWIRSSLIRSFGRDDVLLILAHVRKAALAESQVPLT